MVVNGFLDDGEAEACARLLRGKIWLENLGDVFGLDAASRVRDRDLRAPRRLFRLSRF
jgi:hypothetical protein